MIRVKMLKTAAGPFGVRTVGAIVELDADEALAYVEAGAAAYVGKPSVTRIDGKPLKREPDGIVIGEQLDSGHSIAAALPGEPNIEKPVEDPEELEREQMFKELVDGGTPEEEARHLIWPERYPAVERAVVTPPETAVAPAQRPARRR